MMTSLLLATLHGTKLPIDVQLNANPPILAYLRSLGLKHYRQGLKQPVARTALLVITALGSTSRFKTMCLLVETCPVRVAQNMLVQSLDIRNDLTGQFLGNGRLMKASLRNTMYGA